MSQENFSAYESSQTPTLMSVSVMEFEKLPVMEK